MTTSAETSGFDLLHPVIQHHVVNTLGWTGLRPMQSMAVEPLVAGADAILLAPTAGGKTEAAIFPLLTRMENQRWQGLSVLYVCPLKALLNNLQPRVEEYTAWLGRRAQTRHGDTGAGARRRLTLERPSILLTTPESLEAMLVSPLVDTVRMFGEVRAVVVDEVHAFAGDDRGWHLLAVLERISSVADHPVQRIGLSATVGNPAELLTWLQGCSAAHRTGVVLAPPTPTALVPELALDYVGTVVNAALVLSRLHLGQKRLVFADSRRTVEDVASQLRERQVVTYVSHSSLSLDERRRAEAAFAEARDCVIVSTSTLELGIDVGDLDQVVQVGAPTSVASLLQRLGRTGRRPGTSRNMTLLALDDVELVRATALLLLLGEGYVEPVVPPPQPRHVAAQQLLALALQKGRIDLTVESTALAQLGLASEQDLAAVAQWLLDTCHLDTDSGLAFVGPTAERRFGARSFMELLAVFTVAPEVTVLHGRTEIGTVDSMLLTAASDGPRTFALAGRSWEVTHVDWKRRRAQVAPSERPGRSRWSGESRPYSYALADAIRRVLLGAEPAGVLQSTRAVERLHGLRDRYSERVLADATVVTAGDLRPRWWTFAGARANAVLAAALEVIAPGLVAESRFSNLTVSLRADATAADVAAALRQVRAQRGGVRAALPAISQEALKKLKFSELLPPELAHQTLASRGADWAGAEQLTRWPVADVAAAAP